MWGEVGDWMAIGTSVLFGEPVNGQFRDRWRELISHGRLDDVAAMDGELFAEFGLDLLGFESTPASANGRRRR